MRRTKDVKLICKDSFSYNLTKPYEKFEENETYDFTEIIRTFSSGTSIWYESHNSDYVDTIDNIFKLFYTQDELRDIKLTKILNKENDNN